MADQDDSAVGHPPTAPLEGTIEFFNLVLSLRLTADEKSDLVAFLRCM